MRVASVQLVRRVVVVDRGDTGGLILHCGAWLRGRNTLQAFDT